MRQREGYLSRLCVAKSGFCLASPVSRCHTAIGVDQLGQLSRGSGSGRLEAVVARFNASLLPTKSAPSLKRSPRWPPQLPQRTCGHTPQGLHIAQRLRP